MIIKNTTLKVEVRKDNQSESLLYGDFLNAYLKWNPCDYPVRNCPVSDNIQNVSDDDLFKVFVY